MTRSKQDTAPLTTHGDGVVATLPAERLLEQQNIGAQIVAAAAQDQIRFSQRIGARLGRKQTVEVMQKLVTVTDLIELQMIKDSGEYKGLQVYENEKLVTITTWSDFCTLVEKRSREAIDLDLANLKQLGADFVESMQRIGLGPGVMRDIRKLPADERAAIEQAAKLDDKEALVELIDSLSAKHAKEKAALEKKAAGLQDDLAASRAVAATKEEKINSLQQAVRAAEEGLAKSKIQIAKMPPDQVAASMRNDVARFASEVELFIRGNLNKGVATLLEKSREHNLDQGPFLAGLIGNIELALNQLRGTHHIPATVDSNPVPVWLRADIDSDAVAAAALAAEMAAHQPEQVAGVA